MATLDEVNTFLSHAGINTSRGGFIGENYTPIRDLTEFIGITGTNGNYSIIDVYGNRIFFDYSYGHVLEDHPRTDGELWTKVVGLGKIDAYEVATSVHDWSETGRVSVGSVPNDNPNDKHGSWLTVQGEQVPVPGAALLGIIGVATSAHVLRRRKRTVAA